MDDQGFLKLARKFFYSDLWREERELSRAEAWLDLLFLARISDSTQLVDGRCLSLHRGELVASVRYAACRWHWNKGKVERFYEALRLSHRIETRIETGITIVKLLNYSMFNDSSGTKQDSNGDGDRTVTGQQRDNIEERKKVRMEKQKREPAPVVSIPLGLQVDEFVVWWGKWLEHLKAKRKSPSIHTQELQLGKMAEWGAERAVAAMKHSIERGWQSVYEETQNGGSQSTQQPAPWRLAKLLEEQIATHPANQSYIKSDPTATPQMRAELTQMRTRLKELKDREAQPA